MECYSALKFRNKILSDSTHMRSLEESKSQRQKGEWWVPVPEASQVALVVKNLPANAGDTRDVSSIPGLGRSPGGEHGNPLQYSGLENPADRGPWRAAVHGVTKSRLGLSDSLQAGVGGGESESCSVVSDSLPPHGPYSSWNSPGQSTGGGRGRQ